MKETHRMALSSLSALKDALLQRHRLWKRSNWPEAAAWIVRTDNSHCPQSRYPLPIDAKYTQMRKSDHMNLALIGQFCRAIPDQNTLVYRLSSNELVVDLPLRLALINYHGQLFQRLLAFGVDAVFDCGSIFLEYTHSFLLQFIFTDHNLALHHWSCSRFSACPRAGRI